MLSFRFLCKKHCIIKQKCGIKRHTCVILSFGYCLHTKRTFNEFQVLCFNKKLTQYSAYSQEYHIEHPIIVAKITAVCKVVLSMSKIIAQNTKNSSKNLQKYNNLLQKKELYTYCPKIAVATVELSF